ncbi:MAG TPA: carbon-nitrogen hydrolase family protein [Planctomycetota bacterium]|nr:carbon-nitrogen hydrolase family protein [Planctomycetota bacterium]
MRRPRVLAAAQTIPRRGDVEANLASHLELMRAAADENVGLLVFPELSLTGYELDLAAELAFSERDPRLAPLIDLASSRQLAVVVGAPVRIAPRLCIGAFIVYPDRRVELYTKHRLGAFPPDVNPGGTVPPAEATVFQPGDRNPLVEWDGHTGAVAVCADIGRPAHAKAAAERGARTYAASMFVIPSDLDAETARLRAYAVEHGMAIVFANYGGPSGGLPSAGRSAILSQEGETLTQLDAAGSGIAIAVEEGSRWRAKNVAVDGA